MNETTTTENITTSITSTGFEPVTTQNVNFDKTSIPADTTSDINTETTTNGTTTAANGNGGTSTAIIAGVTTVCVLLVLAIILISLVIFLKCYCKRTKKKAEEPSTSPGNNTPPTTSQDRNRKKSTPKRPPGISTLRLMQNEVTKMKERFGRRPSVTPSRKGSYNVGMDNPVDEFIKRRSDESARDVLRGQEGSFVHLENLTNNTYSIGTVVNPDDDDIYLNSAQAYGNGVYSSNWQNYPNEDIEELNEDPDQDIYVNTQDIHNPAQDIQNPTQEIQNPVAVDYPTDFMPWRKSSGPYVNVQTGMNETGNVKKSYLKNINEMFDGIDSDSESVHIRQDSRRRKQEEDINRCS